MDSTPLLELTSGLGTFLIVYSIVALALVVLTIAGLWKMYAKAGRPGWAAIVPVYNWWVWIDIIERPRWWFWAVVASVLLSWVPVVGIVLNIVVVVLYLLACLDMAKRFGKGTGFGIGLWLLSFVFAPILGFGSAQFDGGRRGQTGGRGQTAAAPWPVAAAGSAVPPPPPGTASGEPASWPDDTTPAPPSGAGSQSAHTLAAPRAPVAPLGTLSSTPPKS